MATAQLYTRSPLCSYKAEEKWRRKTLPSFRAHRFLSFLPFFPMSLSLHFLFPSIFYSSLSFPILNPLPHPDIFHTLFLFRILMNAIDINGYSTSRIYLISKRSDFSKSRDRRSDRYVIRR